MRLPVYLTLMRIVMSPLFLVIYLYYEKMGIGLQALPYVLLFLLAICELSDFFDGFLARKKNMVTDLGKVLDPMADTIFRLTIFFTFTQGIIQLPLIVVIVFFFRDSIVSMLRTLCALRGVALAARLSGKIKAVVQAACTFFILILMIPYTTGCLDIGSFREISFYAALIAATYTVVSGAEYVFANRQYIRQALYKF